MSSFTPIEQEIHDSMWHAYEQDGLTLCEITDTVNGGTESEIYEMLNMEDFDVEATDLPLHAFREDVLAFARDRFASCIKSHELEHAYDATAARNLPEFMDIGAVREIMNRDTFHEDLVVAGFSPAKSNGYVFIEDVPQTSYFA